MRHVHVVSCFLLRRSDRGDEILLLRRSSRVGTYRQRWAGVSGYLESDTALQQAYREIEEEAGLTSRDIRLLAEGEPLVVSDEQIETRWTVHPFLFEVLRPERVRLDWEHTEIRWVQPRQLESLDTVPGLAEALARVLPTP